jgi:formylmethanofuran--tetrahydromethanopterin N-formyltransferase
MQSLLSKIEDTYAEALEGLFCRILVTAERGVTPEDSVSPYIERDTLRFAAYRATSTPSTVVGRIEAGIEKWVSSKQTPDGRDGVVLQFWGAYNPKEPLDRQLDKFYKEISIRISQDIVSATGGSTRVFDYLPERLAKGKIDLQEKVGRQCGGGYEKFLKEYGRETISVPLMMGVFKTDRYLGYGIGVSGGNLWLFCDSEKTARKMGLRAVEAVQKCEGVIASFYVCPSGSMISEDPLAPAPTNYQYCPSLRGEINDSKVPEGVGAIPEVVINGMTMEHVEEAMRQVMDAVVAKEGVKLISAGNYGGKLGRHRIFLRKIASDLF